MRLGNWATKEDIKGGYHIRTDSIYCTAIHTTTAAHYKGNKYVSGEGQAPIVKAYSRLILVDGLVL
jgi:hypothetical protein